jgi:hypothetical protein
MRSLGLQRRVVRQNFDVSEEHITSIFKTEEQGCFPATSKAARRPSSGTNIKQKRSQQKQDQLGTCWFLVCVLFNHEDGNDMFL